MGSVDKRVVEMQFDNQQFEKNIGTSVKSLDKLKQSLDLEKSAKGLAALDKAGRSFSLAGIADGVSMISSRFSALGIIGVTALQNIANTAVNAGKRMIESLTVAPIKTGFAEYETQMNAVQTILANTSAEMDAANIAEADRLDIVNGKLDELNTYADKTIYNFTEMARNIGTFTAAGVALDPATNAVKGIANLAAISGSSSQQATNAMVQLSQAMAAGTVRAIDWNSMVYAGMGGKVFQTALIRTAKAMGVVGKEAKETFAELESGKTTFRASLESGWLSSDILSETLGQMSIDFDTLAASIAAEKGVSIEAAREMAKLAKKTDLIGSGYSPDEADKIIQLAEDATEASTKVKTFTQLIGTMREAAQSGWTQTWEYIVGDFEEAKGLLTTINDYFGDMILNSAASRNAIVLDWKKLGGRQDLIDGFWNIAHAIENVVTLFKDSFETFFPPTTGKQLFAITAAFKAFTEKIKAFTEDSDKMATLQRIFKGIAAALDIVRTAVAWVWNWFQKLLGIAEPAGGSMLEFVASIGDFIVGIRDSIKNSETFQTILAGVGKAIESVKNFVVGIGRAIAKVFGWIFGKIKESGFFTKLGETFNAFVGGIPAAIETLKSWGKAILDYFRNSEFLQNALKKIKNFAGPAIDKIKAFAVQFGEALKAFFGADTSGIKGFWEKLKARFAAMGGSFATVWETVRKKVSTVWESIKAFFAKLFGKKGEAENDLIGQNGIETALPIDTSNWLTTIREKVATAWGNIKTFLKGFFRETVPNFFTKTAPDLMASIPQAFSGLIEKLKTVDWGKVFGTALTVLGGLGALSLIRSIGNIGKGFKSLSGLFDNFGKGAKSVQKGLGKFLGNFDKILTSFNTKTIKHKDSLGNNILKIAAAIGILVAAIIVIGNTEDSKLQKGMTVLGVLAIGMVAMAAAFKKLGPSDSKGILQAALALTLLTIPVALLGNMDVIKLIQGMAAVGLLMAFLAAFTQQAKGLGKSTGLLATAIALNLLIIPVKVLGNMDMAKLIQGMGSVGLLLTFLGAFLQQSKGLGKSSGLIATALALNLLIIPIKVLGNMDLAKSIQGMASIGLLLTFLGAFMQQSKGLGKSSGLIATALALNLLIIPIKILGGMDPAQLGIGLTAIGALLLGLGLFNKKSKSLGKSSGLIAMAVALNLLIIPIKVLGKMDGTELAKSLLTIGGLLIAIGVFNKLSGNADMKQTATQMVSLTGIAALMVGFAAALSMVKDVPWQTMAAFSVGIVAVVAAAVAATLLLKNVNPGDAAKASAALAIIAAGLGAAIAIIAGFVGNAAEGLSGNAVAIASNLKLYSDTAEQVDYGVIGESITAIKDLADMMVDIGSRDIGKFDDFSSQLTLLGARLALFNWAVSGIATGGVDNAVAMVEDIDTIGGKMVEMQNKGYNFEALSLAMTNFGSGLELYATAAVDANALMKDIVGEKAISADALSAMFTEMANVNLPQDTIDKVASFGKDGGTGLNEFALGLTAIGNAVQGYKTSISGINLFDALKSNVVLTMINDLQKNLPVKGNNFFEWFTGSQTTLTQFAEMLVALGGGIYSFSDGLTNYDPSKAENATRVIEDIVAIQGSLSEHKLLSGSILFGKEGTLAELGTSLVTLGGGFKDYIDSLSTFTDNEDTINAATVTLQAMAGIQATLMGLYDATGKNLVPDAAGELKWNSDEDLGTFGENLKSLGDNFKTFAGTISGITIPTNMEDVRKTVDDFANIAVKLNGVTMIYDLSNQLYWFGVHIKDFFSDNNGIGNVTVDNQKVLDVTTAVDKIADIAVKLNGMTGIDFVFLQTMLDGVSTLIVPDFTIIGTDAATALLTGIQNGTKTLRETVRKTANDGGSAAKTTYLTWYNTGGYLGRGLGNGILSMARSVQNAAISVASGAIRSIQMTWAVHSPSRVGNDLGMNFDLGLAGGLDTYAKVVSQSATSVGSTAVESAQMMLNRMTTNLTDGIDTTPTIRPVIDMSNVQNGVSAINGMFNANRSLSAGSFAGTAINRSAANLNIDGARIMSSGNKDVVEAIQTLTDRFDNLSTAVASMKLVLDNGTLVGQLGPNMDKQLGVLAGRRERGN